MPSLHSSTTGLLAREAEPVNMQAGGQASRTRLQHLPQGWRGDVWSVALHAEQHILSVEEKKKYGCPFVCVGGVSLFVLG